MDTVDLKRFYSGGYFLIRAGHPGWEQLRDRLPDKLLSLCDHITPQLDVSWGWPTGDLQRAKQFGVRETQIDEFVAWCHRESGQDMDMWGMFFSSAHAQRFRLRFLPQVEDLWIIGVGLAEELEASRWREPLEAGQERYGIQKRIAQHLAMEQGGQPLGFEVVSFSYGRFGCSWLCSGIDQDMEALYGIRPGQYGLIQSEQDARRVYEWIAEDEMKGQRGEPEPYDYWLLVSYPLEG